MADIQWHMDMENCPSEIDVLIRYDDGTYRLINADDNDTPWNLHYPIKGQKQPGVDYPEAWAAVS